MFCIDELIHKLVGKTNPWKSFLANRNCLSALYQNVGGLEGGVILNRGVLLFFSIAVFEQQTNTGSLYY